MDNLHGRAYRALVTVFHADKFFSCRPHPSVAYDRAGVRLPKCAQILLVSKEINFTNMSDFRADEIPLFLIILT